MRIKRIFAFSLALGFSLSVALPAQAAIRAFAELDVTDFIIRDAADDTQVDGSDVTVTGLVESSSTRVLVASLGADSDGAIGLDSPISFVGAAPAENAFPAGGLGAPPVFAWADTFGMGAAVLPLGTGTDAITAAEIRLSESPGSTDAGNGNANVGVTASFTVTPATTLTAYAEMTAAVETFAESTPLPPGNAVGASTTWLLTVTDQSTNSVVFTWSPSEVNRSVSAAPGGGPNTNNFASALLTSPNVTLSGGVSYSFDLTHTSRVQASTLGVIPEPVSCVVWAGLGLIGLVGWRRKRAKLAA